MSENVSATEASRDGSMMPPRSRTPAIVAGALVGVLLGAGAFALFRSNGDVDCTPTTDLAAKSVARHWNEALLDAVRRDLPAPTVHARNLFHTSAGMFDAWAAYESTATGVYVDESLDAGDVETARNEAISYAAYRILHSRYLNAAGASDTTQQFDSLMEALCYPIDNLTATGDNPAALGNRIAATILERTFDDGANEADGYNETAYIPVNRALVVSESGTAMTDPNRWQPLQIGQMISQNGIPVENGVQEFIDPHWGYVDSFALPAPGPDGLPIDPGDPPYFGDPATDQEFKNAAIEVIRYSSVLDPAANVMIDISPASIGNSDLGTNNGSGYQLNPITGSSYEPNLVNEADFGRAAAEFWADGPSSETPPGHWNTLANSASDLIAPDLRIGATGPTVDRLEWDVKLYLALNGANHDAAVAAWGSKGYYDYTRPISMIRYMGGIGQSSDPDQPSYHDKGLPLEPGLVAVITDATTAPGEKHEALRGHEGEIAVYAWTGTPEDPETEIAGVAWILAVDWVPYQLPTFVTPSFAAYVSGHSAFSRASAEVLTAFTGSEFFPEGLGEWTIPAGSFEFEAGPPAPIVLQWATYQDASDQAGLSRLYGGIHVRADDFDGRLIGNAVGRAAWNQAVLYYGSVID
ncbi:MAG: vanadium-dependent haloperoxidase [bacterium]|nr:vanadium-dependent haloperoxidase [bacterium]